MKNLLRSILAALFILSFANSFATIKQIDVQDFSFSPTMVSVKVGDTLRFHWVNGLSHTTTCNGLLGSILPGGAIPWNQPLNALTQDFYYIVQTVGTYVYVSLSNTSTMVGTVLATLTDINQTSQLVPDKFALSQNYPNPFNPATTISFDIPVSGFTKLVVFDMSGKEISNLVSQNLTAGSYSVNFNAALLSTGVYFYRLEAQSFSEIKKMTLIK